MIDIEIITSEYEVFNYSDQSCEIVSVEMIGEFYRVSFKHPKDNSYIPQLDFETKTLILVGQSTMNRPCRLRKRPTQAPKNVYRIRAGHTSWDKDRWVTLDTIDCLETAKQVVSTHSDKARSTESPFRFMMKKDVVMGEVYDFEEWAAFRYASGDWEPVPWANEPWIKPELAYHFPRMCKERDPGVAYWDSPAQAQTDMASSSTVGSYLNAFYSDVLTATEIENWVHKADPPGELKISGLDEQSIYEAYDSNGGLTHSCMVYRDFKNCHGESPWRSGRSPVRVYGGGDLAVANLHRRGKIVARALVRPETKISGRRYGDVGRMKMALEAAGYTHDGAGGGNDMHTSALGGFEGSKLLYRFADREGFEEILVAPYVDFNYRVAVDKEKKLAWLTLKHEGKTYLPQRTDGLLWDPNGFDCEDEGEEDDDCEYCACCASDTGPDYMTYVNGEGDWCSSCVNQHASWCTSCDDVVRDSSTTTVEDETYCNSCRSRYAHLCDVCDDFMTSTNNVYYANDIETVSYTACDHCVEDGTSVTTHEGHLVDPTTLETCDDCAEAHPLGVEHNCAEELETV